MKKIILPIILFACAMIAFAAQDKVIQIFKDGEVIQSYPLGSIDYIEVNDVVTPPADIEAGIESGKITISWQAVEGATYNIYRSGDNVSYYLIAENITETSYVDTNPLSGTCYYKVKAVINGVESDYSSSSAGVTIPVSGLQSGMYLGITGFNQALTTYPVTQLTADSKAGFDSFVDGMTMKKGTLLYYSVDQSITALQNTQFPEDLFNVAIVTFTDGLDQGSMMMNSNYLTDEEYLTAVNNRIMTEKVSGQSISAYSIGIKGADVSDTQKFKLNLEKLASSADNAFEVSSMSEVNAKFQEIANQLNETSYVQTISLSMPGLANGTKVRFTFDNVTKAELSKLYIEGVFNLQSKSLENVVYSGMTSTSGENIQGTVDGIFVGFTFEGVQTDDKVVVSQDYIKEWTYITSTSAWQINSEFDKDENTGIVNEKKSAAVMLILDCSSSLGEQFATAQTNAKSFIATLCQSAEETPTEPEKPSTTLDNLSTTPIDLSLAISKDGVRYYMTKSQYDAVRNLDGYTVEGLTVISGSDSFIIALNDANGGNTMIRDCAYNYYYLPSQSQGIVISARFSDINSALVGFGGAEFSSSKDYWTSYSSGSYYYSIRGYGGTLSKTSSSSYTYYVREVRSTGVTGSITWENPNHLKLAVKKDGVRSFISQTEYKTTDLTGYEIEGVAVILSGNGFIVSLNNASSNTMAISAATQIYGDQLPNKKQGTQISTCFIMLNKALKAFGGTELVSSSGYWCYYSSGSYYYYICGSGGELGSTTNSNYTYYVRTVTEIE